MKIRTLIIDDEPHAIEVIENHLQKFQQFEVVGKCGDAIQAFQVLQQKSVDLMFLDIKMPGITGTDFLKNLKNAPKVIFTTAYTEYAVDAFDLNAVDYLLKPISFERFFKAIDKIYQLNDQKPNAALVHESPVNDREAYLYLKVERKTIKVNVKDILWIESLRDYIKVVTADNVYITKQKISLLEEMLPERDFVRIHRSFIVAISKISSFYSGTIEIGKHELPIGRNYKNDVQKKLKADGFAA